MNRVEACTEDVLKRGMDDWIQAAEVASVAITAGGARTDDEVRKLSLEIIRKVLREELMVAGDVTEAEGFRPWDLTVDEALVRIEREWRGIQGTPNLGEICWLSNTDSGDAFARSLTAGEGGPAGRASETRK